MLNTDELIQAIEHEQLAFTEAQRVKILAIVLHYPGAMTATELIELEEIIQHKTKPS